MTKPDPRMFDPGPLSMGVPSEPELYITVPMSIFKNWPDIVGVAEAKGRYEAALEHLMQQRGRVDSRVVVIETLRIAGFLGEGMI